MLHLMFGRSNDDTGGIAGLGSLSSAAHRASTGTPTPTPVGVSGGHQRRTFSPLRALRITAGWLLVLGGLAYAGWAIYELASYGTCASGGPYVSARECAPGTGTKIFGITASVFVVLFGVGLTGSWRAGMAAWGLTFTGGAVMFFAGAFGPESEQLLVPFTICGVLFALMGLPGLFYAIKPKSRRERRQTTVRGPYGIQLSVDSHEDGGPAPIVMANQQPGQQPGTGFPWGTPPR